MGIKIRIVQGEGDQFWVEHSGYEEYTPVVLWPVKMLLYPASRSGPVGEVADVVTQKIILVKSTRIVNVRSYTEILRSRELRNESGSLQTNCTETIEQEVNNTVESSWSNSNEISADIKIDYEICQGNRGASLSYTKSWGSTKMISKSETLKGTTTMEFPLPPGIGVVLELSSVKKIVTAKITYISFHCGFTNESTEVITTEFYTGSKVTIRDV